MRTRALLILDSIGQSVVERDTGPLCENGAGVEGMPLIKIDSFSALPMERSPRDLLRNIQNTVYPRFSLAQNQI